MTRQARSRAYDSSSRCRSEHRLILTVASAFTHAIAAGAIGAAFYRPGWPARAWILGVACAIAPDADVIGVALGVPFRSLLGHRGLSHSLLVAAVLAAVVVALG